MHLAVDALNLRNDRRGMGRIVRGVLRVAAADGVEITLLAPHGRVWNDDPEAALLQTLRFGRPSSAKRRHVYDAVWFPWNGIRFAATAPSLAHIHDTFALRERGNWIARRRVCTPLRRAACDADRIATDSAWSALQIQHDLRVSPERILTIPLAPDAFFSAGKPEAPAALPESPYVLIVGAGDPRKNAAFFMQCFGDAFAHRKVTLVAVGSLAPDAECEARARGIRLHREEGVNDARLRDLYRGAACVAVPSLAEGFGLVVVEAQACGAPVIASNSSALPEAAGEAAVLIDPRDREGWRDALSEIVDDERVALRLRALGTARFGSARRDEPARAILAALRDLADHRA
ncbi:MAG: glycosyltransferase family 4 protein [Vulcanimicrobiaceae bacterium]